MKTELWEILVPASDNKTQEFTYKHHKEWDTYVKKITGGVTIMKTAKGQWVSPNGKVYDDKIIPCRIVCTEKQMNEIVNFTLDHYKQEAVMAFRISKKVILRYKEEKVIPEPPERPIGRVVTEGTHGSCPKCGSTEKKMWGFFGKKIGCIQSLCENYYLKK